VAFINYILFIVNKASYFGIDILVAAVKKFHWPACFSAFTDDCWLSLFQAESCQSDKKLAVFVELLFQFWRRVKDHKRCEHQTPIPRRVYTTEALGSLRCVSVVIRAANGSLKHATLAYVHGCGGVGVQEW